MLDAATLSVRLRSRLRTAGRVSGRRERWLPVLVLAAAEAVALVVLLVLGHDQWFTLDDTQYLTQRGTIPGESLGLFTPWGGHWVLVPVLIYRVLFAVFGMRTIIPYVLVVIVLHLVVVALLYAVLVRAGVGRWTSVVTVCLLLFGGVGAEAMVWSAVSPLLIPIAIGLGTVLMLMRADFSDRSLRLARWLLLLTVMCSGACFTVMALVAVFLTLHRGLRPAVRMLAPAVLLYAFWYVVVGHTGDRLLISGWGWTQIPQFVWTGITSTLERATAIPGSGGILLLLLVFAAFAVRDVPEPLRRLAWAGLVALLTQTTLTAMASMLFGIESSEHSRYSYTILLLLTPSIAIALHWVARTVVAMTPADPRLVLAGIGVPLAVSYLATAGFLAHTEVTELNDNAVHWKAFALGTVAAVDAGESVISPTNGRLDEPADARFYATPQIRAALPRAKATGAQRIEAEARFFTGVRPATYGLFQPADIRFESGFAPAFIKQKACAAYTAYSSDSTLVLPLGSTGNEIGVSGPATKVTTKLTRGSTYAFKEWPVTPQQPMHIASTAKDADLSVTFDQPGNYLICTN